MLIRQHARRQVPPFLLEMSRDPAMLIWLDGNSNSRGKPNENYAREVMELFTLGVGRYSEDDVRERPEPFTGYGTPTAESSPTAGSSTTTARKPCSARPGGGTVKTSSGSCSSSRPRPGSSSASSTAT